MAVPSFTHSVGVAHKDDTVTQTCLNMKYARVSAVVICGEHSSVTGIFTERDALKALLAGLDPKSLHIGDIMTHNPQTVTAEVDDTAAMKIMARGRFRRESLPLSCCFCTPN